MKTLAITLAVVAMVGAGCAKKPAPANPKFYEITIIEPDAPVISDSMNVRDLIINSDPHIKFSDGEAPRIQTFIAFKKGSAELAFEDMLVIAHAADYADAPVIAHGYASNERRPGKGWTDAQEEAYNKELSLQRAAAACQPFLDREKVCLITGHGETAEFGPDFESNRVVRFTPVD